MKNTKKLLLTFTLLMAMMFLLAGCGKSFDASRYVKACLDANTHGEFEEYAEVTDSSVEEVEKLYNDMLDSEISAFDAYQLSDEKKQELRTVFEKMYNSFKYEVGEAVKNDDKTYTVPVTTYRLLAFKSIMSDLETYVTDYYQDVDVDNPPSDEEIYTVIADYLKDYLSANVDNPEYEDPQNVDVTVSPSASDSNLYEIPDDQLESLLKSLVDSVE